MMPPKIVQDLSRYELLAERICEAAANEYGVLDKPVLMVCTRTIQEARRAAAIAIRKAGASLEATALLLGLYDHSVIARMARHSVDEAVIERILKAARRGSADA